MTTLNKKQLITELKQSDDYSIPVDKFDSPNVFHQYYTMSDFVCDVADKLQSELKNVLQGGKKLKQLSLTDTYADLISKSEMSTNVFVTLIELAHRSTLSVIDFVKDVFDQIKDEITAKIMDKVFSIDKTPLVLKVALQSTLDTRKPKNEHKKVKNKNFL